jgi:hypothetical protein
LFHDLFRPNRFNHNAPNTPHINILELVLVKLG